MGCPLERFFGALFCNESKKQTGHYKCGCLRLVLDAVDEPTGPDL